LPLDQTRSLVADLASALKIGALPPDASGGYQLTIGGTTTLLIYGGDDETILLIAPLGKLPRHPEYGLVLYLLRANMFNSDLTPFRVAVDGAGGLIAWGRLRIADFSGARLAALIGVLADRIEAMRAELPPDIDR
jgi:Tir chaperone protein (CesT) family